MDARAVKTPYSRFERAALAFLAVLVAVGIWQGYGALLPGGGHAG